MLINPCAKINLGLNVVERRNDGYHNLETVFYPIPLCDELEITIDHTLSVAYRLQTVEPNITSKDDDNIIIKVLHQLRADFPNIPPLDIYLKKRIPMGAGLGGGSSDAAFFMKGVNELLDLGMTPTDMETRLAKLGADCAFFVQAKPTFAEGIGDLLTPFDVQLKGYYLALVKPQDFVSTAQAYARIKPHKPENSLKDLLQQPIKEWRGRVVNDFEESVFYDFPRIEAIKETLYDMGALFALMSGSGSTVFALFKDKQTNLTQIFSDCYVYQSMLRNF